MTAPLVDIRDLEFVLYEHLDVEQLCKSERYAEHSRETLDMVLDLARKLAENELRPTNADGDRQGVTFKNGVVKAPESFHRVYRLYREGGWPSCSLSIDRGGQGFPMVAYCAVSEFFYAGNLAFMAYPGLTLGAARLIDFFGTQEQRQTFMEKMYTGEWGGTMCLTEPQAGTDVGALRTRAKKNADGTYSITGGKIFISSGDHDLTENIVHLALARVEGAPAGTKGISIFIVPKKRFENGVLADNDVVTVAVEAKLGLHGSATCALNFGEKDNCVGYLLGEENSGMQIMFHMMNEARHAVGMQSLALAATSYMHALRYSLDRIQGPRFTAMRDPNAPKVAIFEHPDVRRMLLWMKSVTEGIRALLYYCAICHDRAAVETDDSEAARLRGMVDLLIPIGKAWASDMGFRVAETAIQVHGGYGYCREYPVEQFLRDIKITSIYEGANGIQALDLVGRKLGQKQGALFQAFVQETEQLVEKVRPNDRLRSVVERFEQARSNLVETTMDFARKAMSGDLLIPVLYATPYLELFGDVAVGYLLLRQAQIADAALDTIYAEAGADSPERKIELLAGNSEAAFYRGKIASAEFFSNAFLSLAPGKAATILSGERSAVDMPREAFGRL